MVGSQLQVVATGTLVKTFCRICLAFQNNTELVQPGGADCFPREVYRQLKLFQYDECQALVEPHYANGRQSLSMIGVIHNKIKWMAMSFESVRHLHVIVYEARSLTPIVVRAICYVVWDTYKIDHAVDQGRFLFNRRENKFSWMYLLVHRGLITKFWYFSVLEFYLSKSIRRYIFISNLVLYFRPHTREALPSI